jgi:RNA polymerase sigma-70 factor
LVTPSTLVSGESERAEALLVQQERLASDLTQPDGALGGRFLTLTEEARTTWPRVQVDIGRFAIYIARKLDPAQHDMPRALADICIGDLYLTCGCVMGVAAALSAFDERYVRNLRTFVKDIDSSPARLDEVKQLLRERLLLGSAETPARIGSYSGRGSLAAWVQVVTQRLAFTSLRRQLPPTADADDELSERVVSGPDPELDYLRIRYAEDVRNALQAALRELPARERLILRLHLVDGLSLVKIARVYKVSQSTVSRWLMQSRETVRASTKRHLTEVLGMSSAEFESLARLVCSRLDLGLSTALKSEMDAIHE